MEVKQSADALEINKSPEVIKDAQEEIGKLDVLVCGECHEVFHYVEQFQEHREGEKCSGISIVRENYKHEPKPQVWAFMLWKNAQFKKTKEGESTPTSWTIYQRWCRLDPEEKDTWIAAGQNIQSFTKISSAKIQEIKAKTQPLTKNKLAKTTTQTTNKSNADDDPLEEGEIRLSNLSSAQRVAIKAHVSSNKTGSDVDPLGVGEDSEMPTDEETDKIKKNNDVIKKIVKPAQHNNGVSVGSTTKKPPELRKALRTLKNENTEETIIERILSKRFNQKKKCVEYLVKWENLNESENTWEPRIHFDKCKPVLEDFDKLFNKTKLMPKTAVGTGESSEKDVTESDTKSVGRPQRTSKQKALNQVKVWCGDITDGDEGSGKRKSFSDDDDDSSDSFEKKIKLEEESDTSEDEKPSVTIRRIVKPPNSVNGITKKSSEAPLATTQRVVRVSQKQLPSLSSGVYIMSKTDGIIKLDSNTSPAGGSPLLKVGPKIGQTHIKMIRKDASSSSNITKTVPRLLKTADGKPITSTPKPLTKVLTQRKTPPSAPSSVKPPMKPTDTNVGEKTGDKVSKSKFVDDDSDGLEEMEFPTDLPLPEPDSPPGEFTLCPLTGKILGQPDEPPNEPDESTENTSLDSLVKLAAAELPDVDLDNNIPVIKQMESSRSNEKPSAVQTTTVSTALTKTQGKSSITITAVSEPQSIATTITDLEAAIKPSAIEKSTSNIINTAATLTPMIKTKPVTSGSSILNAALTHARVTPTPNRLGTPKKLLSTPSTVRQKVTVNRTPISRPMQPRPSPTTAIIHKISPSRNKPVLPKTFNNEPPVLKRTSSVTTYKPANVTRRIGNTTIYKTSEKVTNTLSKVSSTANITTSVLGTTTTQPTLVQAAPSGATVINMPLLTTDEEPSTSANTTAPLNEIESLTSLPSESGLADLSTFSLPDSETPLLITGDDGTIYQVAGQNEEGQTILISEGPDGTQQCVIVSSENTTEESPILMTNAPSESEQTVVINAQTEAEGESSDDSQVVAQIIKADPPSPGGTRKVVLMLPDGNLMMTDVTAEQYAALELDK